MVAVAWVVVAVLLVVAAVSAIQQYFGVRALDEKSPLVCLGSAIVIGTAAVIVPRVASSNAWQVVALIAVVILGAALGFFWNPETPSRSHRHHTATTDSHHAAS